MGVLRICLFGGVRIEHSDHQIEIKPTRTIQSLLAYLILQRNRKHPREVLAGLFWGDHDQERARGCLNTAVWRLRRLLEPEGVPCGTYLLTIPPGEIGFNRESPHWLDVAVFTERVSKLLSKPVEKAEQEGIEKLEAVLKLYTGELLEGHYEDWALREREHLRLLYLKSLAFLMKYYAQHANFDQSLAYGQQVLDLDPLREEVHREMIRLYLATGHRALALQQYEACRETLAKELGIPPMEETQALYVQTMGEARANQPSLYSGQVTSEQQVANQLRLALQSYDLAREQFHQALLLLERLKEKNK